MVGVGAVVWDGTACSWSVAASRPRRAAWAIPGGLVELGETAEDAVRREVLEECGIEIAVGPILGLFQPIERDADSRIRYHFTIIDFLATYRSGGAASGR